MDIDKFSPAKHLLWANRTSGGGYSGQNVYVSTESVAEVIGIVKVSGTIRAAEINSLGTTPYVFSTPDNFVPISFILTAISGETAPEFSSLLSVETVNANRPVFLGTDPGNINLYNFFGFITRPFGGTPTHVGALNIDLLPNNFMLVPEDVTDPTAGDFVWKYNLVGYILS